MILFLALYFLVYGGAHAYLFLKLSRAFSLAAPGRLALGAFLLLMILLPVVVRILETSGQERAACLSAWTGYVWMGVVFFAFCLFLVVDVWNLAAGIGSSALGADRSAWTVAPRTAALVALAGCVVLSVWSAREAAHFRTERIELSSPKISAPLRIVQISDVHVGFVIDADCIARIIAVVDEAKPDLVVCTGDLVDGQIDSVTGSMQKLQALRPRLGKFAVTGNHEFYAGIGQAMAFTEGAGFRVLRGEGTAVEGLVNLAGVDDETGISAGLAPPVFEREALSGLDRGLFTILLRHRPEVKSDAAGLFDLQLSGHTHKGQIFPFSLVTRMFFPNHAGDYPQPWGGLLHVSRGTGTWGPPMRFLAPPEITIIDLVPPAGTGGAR